MSDELARPGVEIVQEFRTVTPSIITPTLVPNVVGVCRQVVDVLSTNSAGSQLLNPDALVALPAFFIAKAATGTPKVYTGLNGLHLDFSVNSGVEIVVTFVDAVAPTGLTPATVVSQVNARLTVLGVTSVVAETVGTAQWQLRTTATGDFQSIYIDPTTSGTVLTTFAIGSGKTFLGFSAYSQYELTIPPTDFPDPNSNLDELALELDTVRAFFFTGSGIGLMEAKRTQSISYHGEENGLVIKGNVDLSGLGYPGAVSGKLFTLTLDGVAQSVTTSAGIGSAAALAIDLNALTTGCTWAVEAVTNFLVCTHDDGAYGSTLLFTAGAPDLLVVVGIVAGVTTHGISIAAIDDGNGDAVTPLLSFFGYNFTTAATAASVTAANNYIAPAAGATFTVSDGGTPQTITFAGAEAIAACVTKFNALMAPAAGGHITASISGGTKLKFDDDRKGEESYMEFLPSTAIATCIDPPGVAANIVSGTKVYGLPYLPKPGDELWIDGAFYANIATVTPGTVVTLLRIDRQVAISTDVGRYFYIVAKNLDNVTVGWPKADLQIDLAGNVLLKHNQFRDYTGARIVAYAPVYMMYNAIREDVTCLAASPGLLRFDSTTQLETQIPPLTVDNPLGLGCFYALVNAPGVQITALGVDAISADAPYGTVEAFTRAAEYLEAFEVYAIAPLTHDDTVGEVFSTHVTFMSGYEQKGERIVLLNPTTPTRALDTLVGSGTVGDALTTLTFDTKIVNLSTLLNAAGVNPIGTIATTSGVYLDIASDALHYSIASISGSVVTIRITFSGTDNIDLFYSLTALTLPLITEPFAIRIRGALLLTVGGTADKTKISETVRDRSRGYANRRTWVTFPDKAAATIGGLEQILEGFYLNAAIAGMIGQQPPQQSFTNFPMTGFTRVIGSNDTFSERQLNVMAAGGTYIIVQDGIGLPLTARMALTTDMTSIETRTDSITKVVDFTSKFIRRSLKNFIGRFNITQGFLDTLGSVIQGIGGFLVETGVLIGMTLNGIIQDENARDTVLIDISLDVPYPANYLRVTLVV